MPQYLTPARYRTMGTGASLPSDGVLANHIANASALVNAYCCVPAGYDFRGGSVTDEQHVWDTGNIKRSPSNRVWPFNRPIKTVASLKIEITNNQSILFNQANSLYVHSTESWVEPVDLALTTFGVFGYGILPNIGLRQPVAKLTYTYGYDFTATDESLVTASGSTLYADNQFFTDANIVLKKNGTTVAGANYTVNRTEGTVALSTPTTPGEQYTLTYHYKIPNAVARATAMLVTDVVGAASIASSGLSGLSGIKVEEVELRQGKNNFLSSGIVGPAASMLAPYVVRSMA